MRFIAFLLVVFLQIPVWGGCELADGSGKPAEALVEVLRLYGVTHDGSWQSIQEATERAWLSHGRNTERWEIEPIEAVSPKRTYELFDALGMVGTMGAQKGLYDYGAVLGATVQVVRQRFWFLKSEWERGVRFSTLVALTGDRPLDPKIESEQILVDPAASRYPFRPDWHFNGKLPQNETEMMRLVFDQLDLPKAWREMPVLFVDTPKPAGLTRPRTEHTLLYWLTLKPEPGSILFVSNQPFVCRQGSLLSLYLPHSFCMETMGEGYSFEKFTQEKRGTAIILAELAYRIKLYFQAASTKTGAFSLSRPACLCER